MARVALVCPPLPGHLNPTTTLGRALQRRGHSVTLFHIPAVEASARAEGVEFKPVGSAGGDLLAERIAEMGRLRGLRSLRFAVACSRDCSELLCRDLPGALADSSIDLVIGDQNEPAAGSVAEHLGLPFVNICPSLPLNREAHVPPPFVDWPFRSDSWGAIRNKVGCKLADRMIAPINSVVNRYRSHWGLRPLRRPDDSFSGLAQLCQMTKGFDFPRRELPGCFHYLGPFTDERPSAVPFPFRRLNGKPLIYASLGTLQQRDSPLFRTIAEACSGLPVQLVISLGGSDAEAAADLPGSPIVVKFAPQLAILERASLTITHGGLNTVMQSLSFGVPLVVVPITHDQPAIAARVRHSGTGEVIPAGSVKATQLRTLVERVMQDSGYGAQAGVIAESIQQAGGVEKGADIVESLLGRK